MRRLRLAARLLLGLLCLPFLYLLASLAFALLPAGADPAPGEPAVDAYVLSNGVHTDLVFPLAGSGQDWTRVFPAVHFRAVPADAAYVAIGWGDREFYLNTPRWRDLTARRALQALSGSGRSLAHVSFLRRSEMQQGSYRVPLSSAQYATLTQYVLDSLVLSGEQAVPVPGRHYGPSDAFFEARGSYNLFNTCNTWTGRGLRRAGVRIGAWTPFDFNVVRHLQPGVPPAGTASP
jgi:uncharacterized protein (TIGR02117 family)